MTRMAPTLAHLVSRRREQRATLFPYTTLFRSKLSARMAQQDVLGTFPRNVPRATIRTYEFVGKIQHSREDLKSTRLYSSHVKTTNAGFRMKKKRKPQPDGRSIRIPRRQAMTQA